MCHHIHLLDFPAITVELEDILFIKIMLDLAEFHEGGGGGGGGGGEILNRCRVNAPSRLPPK